MCKQTNSVLIVQTFKSKEQISVSNSTRTVWCKIDILRQKIIDEVSVLGRQSQIVRNVMRGMQQQATLCQTKMKDMSKGTAHKRLQYYFFLVNKLPH